MFLIRTVATIRAIKNMTGRHCFATLVPSEVLPGHMTELPEISEPSKVIRKREKEAENERKALEKYQKTYGVDPKSSAVAIKCSKPEFNHFAGQRYPKKMHLKLFTEYWYNSTRHKNEWFTIYPDKNKTPYHRADAHFSENFHADFNDVLEPEIVENIAHYLGVESIGQAKPSQIQSWTFRSFASQRHLFIAAETGSGKTLAVAAPILSNFIRVRKSAPNSNCGKALILAPSAELAEQLTRMFSQLSRNTEISVSLLDDLNYLNSPPKTSSPHILVATVRRLSQILKSKSKNVYWSKMDSSDSLITNTERNGVFSTDEEEGVFGILGGNLNQFKYLVFDEVDWLLDNAFNVQMREILTAFNVGTVRRDRYGVESMIGSRLLLLAATVPDEIQSLVESIVTGPDSIHYVIRSDNMELHRLPAHVRQTFARIRERDKFDRLTDILAREKRKENNAAQTLIFVGSIRAAFKLKSDLAKRGFDCVNLCQNVNNNNNRKNERSENLKRLTEKSASIFIATDVIGRGIDTFRVSHVVNYEFPHRMTDYVHRAGRVGRCGSPFLDAARITSFINTQQQIELTNVIEECARRGRPLPNMEGQYDSPEDEDDPE